MRSIQNRILCALAGLFSIATLVLLSWTWSTTNHEVEEVYDASLVQFARQFASQLTLSDDPDTLLSSMQASVRQAEAAMPPRTGNEDEYEESYRSLNTFDPGHYYEQNQGFQVWNKQGSLLYSSPSELQLPAPDNAGFDTHSSDNSPQQRSYTLYLPKRSLWIRASQPLALRTEVAGEVAEQVLLPLAVVIASLIVAITLTVNLNLRPLKKISRELDQRNSAELSPINSQGLPSELQAPVDSLNRMFQRVADTLQRERRFTSDAAHELRTPLAALRVHIERLALCDTQASPLSAGLNRLERVVTQLLMLARLEPRKSEQLDQQALDGDQLAANLIAELVPHGLKRGVQIELINQTDQPLYAEPTLIEILLRNLIENAIRYTSIGDTIIVSLSKKQQNFQISVADHGPGLNAAQKAQVVQRFYRQNKADSEGAGLGFSIIDQIVTLHQGEYQLLNTTDEGGLTVQVKLPQP